MIGAVAAVAVVAAVAAFTLGHGRRSWLHLDLYTNDQEAEVERLIKLGATRYPWRYRPNADFVVLEDPDGNLFCVVEVAESK